MLAQLRARGLTDRRVLDAMDSVPREEFVEPGDRPRAYADAAIPIAAGQAISQPLMVAIMTELLRVEPGMRVLEIGTGSGYQAAILAVMGCQVTGIERLSGLATTARARIAALGLGERVDVRVGDGTLGAPDGAPWPRILVTAAAQRIPQALAGQLAEGGRIVIPVGTRWEQDLLVGERRGTDLEISSHGGCVFVPLVGEGGWR